MTKRGGPLSERDKVVTPPWVSTLESELPTFLTNKKSWLGLVARSLDSQYFTLELRNSNDSFHHGLLKTKLTINLLLNYGQKVRFYMWTLRNDRMLNHCVKRKSNIQLTMRVNFQWAWAKIIFQFIWILTDSCRRILSVEISLHNNSIVRSSRWG